MIDYKAIAKRAGYEVDLFGFLGKRYYWYRASAPNTDSSSVTYTTEEEAWEMCVKDNGLDK